jgi:hypothetical protein
LGRRGPDSTGPDRRRGADLACVPCSRSHPPTAMPP